MGRGREQWVEGWMDRWMDERRKEGMGGGMMDAQKEREHLGTQVVFVMSPGVSVWNSNTFH
jgi:hypothetical protein